MAPPKGHRPGLLRTHSRTPSGGSSKNLNLHFTQKDLLPSKHIERAKKALHETHARTTSPFSRPPNGAHAALKEPIQTVKRLPPLGAKPNGAKAKAGFTFANPSLDEDEWVSSESGAVTPVHEPDAGAEHGAQTPLTATIAANDSDPLLRVDTAIPRVDTARPSDHAHLQSPRRPSTASTSRMPALPPTNGAHSPHPQQRHSGGTAEPRSHIAPPSPDAYHHSAKRRSITRPPSTHSVARSEAPLRPHPLIRGQSYGQPFSTAPRPVPLAPLTVRTEVAPAQISASPPHSVHTGAAAIPTSPSSSRTTLVSPTSPKASLSQRRLSVSSARSVATLPMPPAVLRDARPMRHRTLSAISSSSSSAALSSLALIPSISRPATPQIVSFFPAVSTHSTLEMIHPLLPAPYNTAHMTLLAHRTPIRESYDRVMRAKQAR